MSFKHRWGRIATVSILAVLIFPMTRLGCELLEFKEADYDGYAEAVASGAPRRGWLPSLVPTSAVDIHELHAVDSNAQWLQFSIPVSEVVQMTSSMSTLSLEEARRTGVNRPWRAGVGWPPELSRVLIGTPRDGRLIRFFRSPDRAFCLAVETQKGRVFAWRCDRVV